MGSGDLTYGAMMTITPGGNPVCPECTRWNCICDRTVHHPPDMSDEDAKLFAEYLDWLKANRPSFT